MSKEMSWSTNDMERFEVRRPDGVWVMKTVGEDTHVSPPAGRAYPLSMMLALSRPDLDLVTTSLLVEAASNWAQAVGGASLALAAGKPGCPGFEVVMAKRRYACSRNAEDKWQVGPISGSSLRQVLERLETHLACSGASHEVEIDIQMSRDLHGLAKNAAHLMIKRDRLRKSGATPEAEGQMQTLIDDHRARLEEMGALEVDRLCPPRNAEEDSNVVPLDAFRQSMKPRR